MTYLLMGHAIDGGIHHPLMLEIRFPWYQLMSAYAQAKIPTIDDQSTPTQHKHTKERTWEICVVQWFAYIHGPKTSYFFLFYNGLSLGMQGYIYV